MTSIAGHVSLTNPTAPLRLPGALDLILRGQDELDVLLEEEQNHAPVIRKLLAIAILGLAAQGFAVGLFSMVQAAHPFADRTALWMPLAFVAAFLGALSICLPSFYFYTQLSGIDASFRLVTAQALRTQATTSMYLLGVLPVYLTLALSSVVTRVISPDTVLAIGYAAPFLVGLIGVRMLYRGFRHMLTYLEITHQRRGAFLLRMVLAWSLVYSVVAPVALYRAVEALSQLF